MNRYSTQVKLQSGSNLESHTAEKERQHIVWLRTDIKTFLDWFSQMLSGKEEAKSLNADVLPVYFNTFCNLELQLGGTVYREMRKRLISPKFTRVRNQAWMGQLGMKSYLLIEYALQNR